MGRSRDCEEWFEELTGDFGFEVTHETHIMYYELIIASKRLALWALTNPRIEPDLKQTAHKIVGATLGMDPEDGVLHAFSGKLETTEDLVHKHEPLTP